MKLTNMNKLFSFDHSIIFLFIILGITLKSIGKNEIHPLKEDIIDLNPEYNKYDSIINAFDCYLDNTVSQHLLPGAAVSVVKDQCILLQKCYGVKKFGTKDSVNKHTVFRLGSVSKGFAAVLTGVLVKENVFGWDDSIKNLYPDFNILDDNYEKEITIRHILSQTTGMPRHAYTDLLDDNVSYENIKPLLCSIPSIGPPGKYYSYQNVIYSMIADVMKSVTGENYSELMQEKIFDPLNMCDASTDYINFAKNGNIAYPHIKLKNGDWYTDKINDRYYTVAPAAGVNASISDMTSWLMAMLGNYNQYVDTSTLHEIFSPHIKCYNRWQYKRNWKKLDKAYYGMGWRVFDYNGKIIAYHGGYVRGYKAEIAIIPEDKTGIVLLTNAASFLPDKYVPQFIDDYLTVNKK